jgi:hypothetical protein
MSLLGTLLRNNRPAEANYAWNQANLAAPDTIGVTSSDFTDGGTIPARHMGTRAGGENVSPQLAWSEPPAGTAALLLLIEDLDAPLGSSPAVHTLAVIDPAAIKTPGELPAGALDRKAPAAGVTLLRSVFSRGYFGPEPLKGHGPHRYVFQLFALAQDPAAGPARDTVLKTKPRAVLASVVPPVLARGRLTGMCER